GALSEKATWRILFWINLPASASAFLFVLLFLQVRTPAGGVWGKLVTVDWLCVHLSVHPNILADPYHISPGVRYTAYTWTDAHVLAPLITGLALMVVFVVYEKYVPQVPTMHWDVVTNQTAIASLIATFLNGITSISIICTCISTYPFQPHANVAPGFLMSPSSFLHGPVVLKVKRYLPGNCIGWAVVVIGFGIVSMLRADTSLAVRVVSQILVAAGMGIVISALPFPLMAHIPVERVGSALAFQAFLRTLSQTRGITISASILQNTVKRRFPARFVKELPDGSDFAYAALTRIAALPEPLQHEVKVPFGEGISAIYRVMIGVAALGFVCPLFMKEVPMRGKVDPKFALKERDEKVDEEAGKKEQAMSPPPSSAR
ncbi:hypothetical protein DFH06DRAFT_981308, partial [Mycena polygramma]